MKRDNNIQNIEYREICKTVRKRIRHECRKHKITEVADKIKESKSIKKAKREISEGTSRISCVLDKSGAPVTDQDDILERIEEFYTELYSTSSNSVYVSDNEVIAEVPSVTISEVRHALSKMANDKAVGPDGVAIEALKAGGSIVHKELAELYTKCLQENKGATEWKASNMILIYKKGDYRNLKNYRPISLLSNIYKLFTKILTKRLERLLDENQPVEQAGFRSGYSTIDHIHAINQLREKCKEYKKPLCTAFVDYEKAFDSIETTAVLESLKNQGIDESYIITLADIYRDGSTKTKLHKESNPIPIRKGVRQGDTISPKLFTAGLEDIFRNLSWQNKGISIHGDNISNLRFADDVTIISETLEELETCLNELDAESRKRGLKINMDKTKIVKNDLVAPRIVKIQDKEIEEVDNYIYLGQRISLLDKNMQKEISRRIQCGWKVFNDNKFLLKSEIPITLKRKLFNQCILPAMTYACETWTMTKSMQQKLAAAQRRMERSMIGITLKDRKTNEWIRNKTKVQDILEIVKRRKWTWAGHVSRMTDNRWTARLTDWRPMDGKRSRGRPLKRWRDELDHYWNSVTWKRKAGDRQLRLLKRCSW